MLRPSSIFVHSQYEQGQCNFWIKLIYVMIFRKSSQVTICCLVSPMCSSTLASSLAESSSRVAWTFSNRSCMYLMPYQLLLECSTCKSKHDRNVASSFGDLCKIVQFLLLLKEARGFAKKCAQILNKEIWAALPRVEEGINRSKNWYWSAVVFIPLLVTLYIQERQQKIKFCILLQLILEYSRHLELKTLT